MKFLFDRHWSPYLARAIDALAEPDGDTATHLDSRFDPDTPDVDWITSLVREGGWAIVTMDKLRKSVAEREARNQTGIVTFIFARQWAHADRWEQAWGLVRWWPRIRSVAHSVEGHAWQVPYRFSPSDRLRPAVRRT